MSAKRPPGPPKARRSPGQVLAILAALVALALIAGPQPRTPTPAAVQQAAMAGKPLALSCAALEVMAEDLGIPHGSAYEDTRQGRALGVCR